MARAQTRHARSVSVSDGTADEGAQFRAGSELREARERLGWDLGEVAAALRIKLSYLQAIEDGQISALPGNAYALGFLRTYATTLGLDPDDLTRRFRAEAQDVNRKPELAFPSPVPERGVPVGALALLGLVILIAGYAAWYRFSEHEQTASHTVPPVPEQLLAAPKATVSPQVASVMPAPGSAPPVLPPAARVPAPASPAAAQTVPSPTPSAPATASPSTVATQSPPAKPPAPASNPTPTSAATTGPAPSMQPGLVLHASATTWIQVRDADGRVTYDHILQPGDSWSIPAGETGLTLTTGNAGGLQITDAGTALGDLGRIGAVRRNIPLTEAGVKQAIAGQPSTETATPPHPIHRTLLPAAADDSADQLNARQLDRPHS